MSTNRGSLPATPDRTRAGAARRDGQRRCSRSGHKPERRTPSPKRASRRSMSAVRRPRLDDHNRCNPRNTSRSTTNPPISNKA